MSDIMWRTAADEIPERDPRRRRVAAPAGDAMLGLTVAGLIVFGLIMVYSASSALGAMEFNNPSYYLQRQLLWVAAGLVALLVARRIDYRQLRSVAYPAAAGVAALMLLVLVPHIGYQVNGARRWFRVAGFLFQPSELAKFAAVLFLAVWLERRADWLRDFERGLIPFAVMLGGAAVVVAMLQKDLGTAMILVAICLAMFLVAGARLSHLALLLAVVAVAMTLSSLVEAYRLHRLLCFANPWADPQGCGFQTVQSVLALGRGGLTGAGLGQSIQKFQWLPEAHTDFIFAIVGEELGMVGTVGLLAAFGLLAWRGYRAALRAPDLLGMLLAGGITTWFVVQALINIAAVSDSVPVTGIPLPFVSYGGTSLAVSLGAVGVLLNISAQGQKVGIKRESSDLGWRDRRAHLSRARRRSGAQV